MRAARIAPTLLSAGQQKEHEYLYRAIGSAQPGAQAVRMGKFKGIGGTDGVKLYDLSTDIGEAHDLAAEHPDVARKMCDIMAKAWVPPRSQQDDGKYTGEPAKTKQQ